MRVAADGGEITSKQFHVMSVLSFIDFLAAAASSSPPSKVAN